MSMKLKHAMLTGASALFLAVSGAAFTSSPTQAGPLAVAPKANIAINPLVEKTQYRRGGRVAARGYVRRGGVRYARGGYYGGRYYGGRRYVYRRGYYNPFFPVAALGLFAGALGAATYNSSPYYCDPAYYTWNYSDCNPGYYSGYYPAYYGGYSGGYYPAYWGGYYPAWRGRRVVYRSGYHRPRTVRYRAVAPRRHFVGSRTYVRSGYAVRRVRH